MSLFKVEKDYTVNPMAERKTKKYNTDYVHFKQTANTYTFPLSSIIDFYMICFFFLLISHIGLIYTATGFFIENRQTKQKCNDLFRE